MDKPLDVNVDCCEFCNYEKVHEFTSLIPSISVEDQLLFIPLYWQRRRT